MKTKILGLLAVGLLAGPMAANGGVITYDFETSLGNGYFSYDDSNTTTINSPSGIPSNGVTSWYSALSFVFGGVSVASPVVQVADNFGGVIDCMVVSGVTAGGPVLSLCGLTSLWTGIQLSNLNGRTTADFMNLSTTINGQRDAFISLAQRVPEPGTLALLSLGLAGLGLSRRRKAA